MQGREKDLLPPSYYLSVFLFSILHLLFFFCKTSVVLKNRTSHIFLSVLHILHTPAFPTLPFT
ncbi:hypothetical protein I7I50_03958 [Histoplasma capsulatum G186AR]|uniref:Uncharacterized protein n=1 Tax=Ajellomyces capsulatus TaxID=5037 RepID=A0A8H8CXN1_AJECA|nr:hypothetical protein I7I52_04866 [Histoplasma capsulatum]QSS74973.1 hypothetical protein I7I50_03958 [Histoplasma capsulatum G186AR]